MMRRLLTISRNVIVTETPTACSPSWSNIDSGKKFDLYTFAFLVVLLSVNAFSRFCLHNNYHAKQCFEGVNSNFATYKQFCNFDFVYRCEFMTQEELMAFLGEHEITLTEMREEFRAGRFFESRKEKRLDGENDAAFRFRLVVDKTKYSINFIKFFCSICKFRESHHIFSWLQFLREVWPECKKPKMVAGKFDRRLEDFTKVKFFQDFLRKCPLLKDESVTLSGQSTGQTVYYYLESFQDSC